MKKEKIKTSTWYRLYTDANPAHKTSKEDVGKYLCGKSVVGIEDLIEIDSQLFPVNKKCRVCKDVEGGNE